VLPPAYDALVTREDVDCRARMGDSSAVIRSSQGSSHSDAQCALSEIPAHAPIGKQAQASYDGTTLAQLSKELGISKERVRQLQREAERMLREGHYALAFSEAA
jgi:RNA polymerase primary sigma factor